MAGIGFLLRKLAAQDNLSGIIRAYFHSALVAVGPWIMIVVALTAINMIAINYVDIYEMNEFLAILIYNFFFSFILSGPLYMVSARYVADCLYLRNTFPIPGIFVVSLYLLVIPALILSFSFYVFYAKMGWLTIYMSITNFILLGISWIVMLYLSCIRNFKAITYSWMMGMILTVIFSIWLSLAYGALGMLTGLNLGIIFLLAGLMGNILAEFPFRFRNPKEYRFYFRYYKGLFWGGFFLYAGMWIDKIIMWWAPESVIHLNFLRTYPTYDGGMFFSYLTIVPVMALFIFSLETNFYDSYIQYIINIERNAPLSLIEEEKIKIFDKIKENGRAFLILQGSISLVIIVLAPTIFKWLGANYEQLNIFRIGTLGAFFAAMNLFIVILFSYFDSQDNMVKITSFMLITNVIFTLLTLYFGFNYYGYGYTFSMILTFFLSASLLVRFLDQLNYHIFITNIVKKQTIIEHYSKNNQRLSRDEINSE